jgi:aminoglycoside/choline kinase family phosphotransferase
MDGLVRQSQARQGEVFPMREFVSNSDIYFSMPRGFSVPVALHDHRTLSEAWDHYVIAVLKGPQCLLHGDAHVGNTFTEPNGTVGFLDWQCASTGYRVVFLS